jgi:GntR family transcriptional regulator, arabinose operon transcriptional repressor
MPAAKQLTTVIPQPGRPLYQAVQAAICDAIDAGTFAPGDQMPNTKQLSTQLGVSLVTAHRAMQELMLSGVLERSQGRGTFVHHRQGQRRKIVAALRVGLVFHPGASLADFYHGQILDGVHQASDNGGVDLILLRLGEDIRNECNGYLFLNPLAEDIDKLASEMRERQPALVVGAQSHESGLPSFDVDNAQIARLAVEHLAQLGHRRIGFLGAAYKISNSLDRLRGFHDACREFGLDSAECPVIKGGEWRLNQRELTTLADLLNKPSRPTAFFAAGYTFALDVYAVADILGLRIPQDLSIVGVDDPPGAAHLTPPMSTIRQPLVELGGEALRALSSHIQHGEPLQSTLFPPELVTRKSSGPAPAVK